MAFYVSYEGTLRSKIAEIDAQMEQEINRVKAKAARDIRLIKHKADEARWEAAIEEATHLAINDNQEGKDFT